MTIKIRSRISGPEADRTALMSLCFFDRLGLRLKEIHNIALQHLRRYAQLAKLYADDMLA